MDQQYQTYGTMMTWSSLASPTPVPLPQKSEDSDTLGVFFIVAAFILVTWHHNRRKDPDHDHPNRPE